jgi:hypothetical protein
MRSHETEQQQLFLADELIIPESVRLMKKAVAAIHAVPLNQSQSLNGRRLFDACILVVQLDFRARDRKQVERIRAERVSPMFEVSITDLARLAQIPGKNYKRLYEELDALFETVLKWNVVNEDGSVAWEMKSHFLASLGFGTGHKRGLIRFSIDPSILAIVLEPTSWATLSLQAMQGLGTAYSYALYQNCWRYVNTHAKVTAALPTATWVQLLMGPSRYVVDAPGGEKRVVNYGDFKRRVLTESIARVNANAALSYTLELKEILQGKRVARLQFKFIPKKQAELGLPLTWPTDVTTVLESLGFGQREIADMSQARSLEEVAEALVRLKEAQRRLQAENRPITSKKAYFLGILNNIGAGAALDDIDQEKIEADVRAQESKQLAEQRQQRLQEQFASHQADRFIAELFALPEAERKQLLADFDASPQGGSTQMLVANKGWVPGNRGALAVLRSWVMKEKEAAFEQLLPAPEDRDFEAWLAWRLEQAQAGGAGPT